MTEKKVDNFHFLFVTLSYIDSFNMKVIKNYPDYVFIFITTLTRNKAWYLTKKTAFFQYVEIKIKSNSLEPEEHVLFSQSEKHMSFGIFNHIEFFLFT